MHGKYYFGSKPVAGFDKHPENRNPGGWKKETAITYQYQKFIRMSAEELEEWHKYATSCKGKRDKKNCSTSAWIAYKRVMMAKTEAGLADTKELTDRTEGRSTQKLTLDTSSESTAMLNSLQKMAVIAEQNIKQLEDTKKSEAVQAEVVKE